MNTKPLLFSTFLTTTAFVHSQNESGASVPPLGPSSTAARIIGPIPDGTPPSPEPPKLEYHIATRDILTAKTHQQGGRTITVREIKPIALPQPPAPFEVVPTAADIEFRAQMRAYYAANPRPEQLCLGATVFRSANQAPRTLVRYWLIEDSREITFWSSADFSLIAGGISTFKDSAGATHSIFMSWSTIDDARATKLQAITGRAHQPPEIPTFPEGKATFQFIGETQPAPETLTAIQSLHDIYNTELPRLQTAYQGREQAKRTHEAYLRANPPQPQNITLNYWRTEKPSEHRTSNVKH
jgi:hypothetical protein